MNMSSGCVLVATADEFRAGTGVEISIEWPFRLDGGIPLQLVASGKVVRSETTSFALLLTRHQFRFTKKRIETLDPPHDYPSDQTTRVSATAVGNCLTPTEPFDSLLSSL